MWLSPDFLCKAIVIIKNITFNFQFPIFNLKNLRSAKLQSGVLFLLINFQIKEIKKLSSSVISSLVERSAWAWLYLCVNIVFGSESVNINKHLTA